MPAIPPSFRLVSALLATAAAMTQCSAAALDVPEVSHRVTIEFATPRDAEAASLVPLPLPEGRELAFSSRWDDTNMNATNVANVLKKHGIRGTFFLSYMNHGLVRALKDANAAFGTHTTTHVALGNLQISKVFDEIARARVELEAASDTPVVSFVLPITSYRSRLVETRTEKDIGEILRRSGYLASPEVPRRIEREYDLPADRFFTTYHFDGDDRESDPAKFMANLQKTLKELKEDASGPDPNPHLTLGTHPWHTATGLANLDANLAEVLKNRDWWFCTQEEYVSYRYQYFHSAIRKKGVSGKSAIFEIVRPHPADLVAAVPMSVALPAGAVRIDGRAVDPGAKSLEIPYPESCGIPGRIAEIRNRKNSPDFFASEDSESPEFPGVKCAIAYDTARNAIRLQMRNDSAEPLLGIDPVLRLPLYWKDGARRLAGFDLQPGGSHEQDIPLGDVEQTLEYREGEMYVILQMNFNGGSDRIYATLVHDNGFDWNARCMRNSSRISGLFRFTDGLRARLAALSDPQVPPEPVDGTAAGRWRAPATTPRPLAPMTLNLTPVAENWKAIFADGGTGTVCCSILYEFDSPKEGEAGLFFVNNGSWLFVNGKEVPVKGMFARHPVPVAAGRNRVILATKVWENIRIPFLLDYAISFSDNPRYEFLTDAQDANR